MTIPKRSLSRGRGLSGGGRTQAGAAATLLTAAALATLGPAQTAVADEPALTLTPDAWSGSWIGGLQSEPQVAQAATRYDFQIAPQPLTSALKQFGEQSGHQFAYGTGDLEGLRTRGISGSYTAEQALQQLLAGTGLVWRFTDSSTVILEKPVSADGAVSMLGPITVTGERVDRTLMDTASSVAVFDSKTLEELPGLQTTGDLLSRIPNVVESGTNNFAPAIRGIDGTGPAQGADAFFAGVRPRLNVQIDGRPASYNEVVFGDTSLWDVDQIEVFRGPQSTLQGRNAIAGAVIVTTKDPVLEGYEADAQVIVGNQQFRQYSGVVSAPLIEDQLGFRVAFDRQTFDSFVSMEPFQGVEDPEDFKSTTLRAKLLIEPKGLADFSTLVTFSYVDTLAPQTETVTWPFGDFNAEQLDMPTFENRTFGGIIDTTWYINDQLDFENTLSMTDLQVRRRASPGDGNAEINGFEIAEEPLLRFSGLDGRLEGLGGLYFFHASQNEYIDLFGGGTFDDKTTTIAAFGEGTYALLEDLDLTLGGRLERELRDRVGGTGPFAINFNETYSVFLPKVGLAWHVTEEVTLGGVISRGYNAGGAGFTYDVPFESYTYEPEYVWNYEAYVRADLLDGRLVLTGNAFYADYKDMQLPFDLNPDPDIWSVAVRNAKKVVTYGAELGAQWLPLDGLQLFANVGLLKTDIKDYPDSGLEGNDLPRSPAFTTDFGLIYSHPSGLQFSTDARFSDSYYSDVNDDPRGKVDPYFVVNAQLGYSFSGRLSGARVFAFVDNLFNANDPILLFPGDVAADDTATLLRPRTYGVGLQVSF